MTVRAYLEQYAGLGMVRMHMPGHKGLLTPYDVTESEGLPIGRIEDAVRESERATAVAYGADRAFYLSGSTTGGILAAVHALPSGAILVPRFSHRSVWSACALFDREPIVPQTSFENDLPVPMTAQDVEAALKARPDIVASVITSPDYYGRLTDLSDVRAVLDGRTLIVDSAHGAHFGLRPELPPNAAAYGDVVLLSAHKTLPSLTQSAIALVKADYADAYRRSLELLSTTSPSYLLFASIESGVERARESDVSPLIVRLKQLPFRVPTDDPMRVVLDSQSAGTDGAGMEAHLIRNGIVPEFAGERYVVLIVTCADTAEDIGYLADVLEQLPRKKILNETALSLPPIERVITFLEATRAQTEEVPIGAAVGRIAGAEVGLYPPCQPLIVRGERYSAELVEILLRRTTFGIIEGKVSVTKCS